MDPSLSVVLPVHNAESTILRAIDELLEVLPDIAARFEILIVDDGSTDQTEEIAHDLARRFPQLRVARHQRRRGAAAAVQTAMARTTGDVVFVHDEATEISAAEIRRLWEMRHDKQRVMARAEMPRKSLSPHLLDRLTSWSDQMRHATQASGRGGIQMIRREAVEDLDLPETKDQNVRVCQSPGTAARPTIGHTSTPSQGRVL